MTKKKHSNDYKKVVNGLHFAWEKLRKHPRKDTAGNDKETINSFSSNYSQNIEKLEQMLLEEKFLFSPLKRAEASKGREILVPTINERIVTISILNAIFPRLETLNSGYDYSRRGIYLDPEEEPDFEGTPLAVEKIQKAINDGYVWVLEADIKKFFDFVPKEKIFDLIKRRVTNKKVLNLIKQIIYFKVKDKGTKEYSDTQGIAQGSSLSPILASIYLYNFDMYVSKIKNVRLVRYVDDFVILCKDEKTAYEMHDLVFKKLNQMGLNMYVLGEKSDKNVEKTKITLARGYGAKSFDFLGLTFNNTDVDISQKKKDEIDKKIKEIIHSEKTTNLLTKIRSLESRINGYIEHYRKAHYSKTIPSLVRIINSTQEELRSYYITRYKKITSRDPFHKLTTTTIDRLFNFMGIDFEHLIIKAKTLPKKKV